MSREKGVAGKNLRIGVCGVGHWAETVHLPVLAAMPEVDLVAVWGRNRERGAALAQRFALAPFTDFAAMLEEVDAVSFAVPPGIQAGLALQAARAGKHLLLEKPVATTLAEADRLLEVVEEQQLRAVVFLTRLFVREATELIAQARAGHHDRCAATWSSKALLPGTPYTGSAWRNGDYGTLWDLGPHVLSMLIPALGPVSMISANRLRKAKFAFRLLHEGGAESSVVLDQMDEALSTRGSHEHYVFSGGVGEVRGGPFTYRPADCYEAAARVLIEGGEHAAGAGGATLRFGRDLVAVLEAACASIESAGEFVAVRP